MDIQEIAKLLEATFVTNEEQAEMDVEFGFASDLMSDVLTLKQADNVLLVTGLCNIQTIRTAEMAGVRAILFARNKNATSEMIEIAQEEGLILLQCKYSLFRTAGILYGKGLKSIY